MNTQQFYPETLRHFLIKRSIATLDELKTALGTDVAMTVFRKLKKLNYISSYSHRGKYYSLHQIAQYNDLGLWSFHDVHFSRYGTLSDTVREIVTQSSSGYTAGELESIVHVKTAESLLHLWKKNILMREMYAGSFIYYSGSETVSERQRKERIRRGTTGKSDTLNEAIVIFFSLLNEKQRRLFAGFESIKFGHGGDKRVAEWLGMSVHTVARGRRELIEDITLTLRCRQEGGGRPSIEKKIQKS